MLGTQLYSATKSGNYSDFLKNSLNQVAPGLGNAIAPIVSPAPGSRTTPVDSYLPEGNVAGNLNQSSLSKNATFALIAAGAVLFLLIIKKMRS